MLNSGSALSKGSTTRFRNTPNAVVKKLDSSLNDSYYFKTSSKPSRQQEIIYEESKFSSKGYEKVEKDRKSKVI